MILAPIGRNPIESQKSKRDFCVAYGPDPELLNTKEFEFSQLNLARIVQNWGHLP